RASTTHHRHSNSREYEKTQTGTPTRFAPIDSSLRQRDHVDLHRDVFRQARHFHRGARRRRILADLSIHLIHLPELGHVLQEYRSEEHTSELQSLTNLVCRPLLATRKSDTDPP